MCARTKTPLKDHILEQSEEQHRATDAIDSKTQSDVEKSRAALRTTLKKHKALETEKHLKLRDSLLYQLAELHGFDHHEWVTLEEKLDTYKASDYEIMIGDEGDVELYRHDGPLSVDDYVKMIREFHHMYPKVKMTLEIPGYSNQELQTIQSQLFGPNGKLPPEYAPMVTLENHPTSASKLKP